VLALLFYFGGEFKYCNRNFLFFDPFLFQLCFGLQFGERESVAQAKRLLERSRSETTVAVPQAEARRTSGAKRMPLVTSALFAKRNRCGRKGNRADQQTVK
jgi:hypothetical protein